MADAPESARRFHEQQKRLSRWGLLCFVIAVPGFFAFATQLHTLGALLVFTAIAMMIGGILVYSRCPRCGRLIMRRSVDGRTGVCVSCAAILTIDVSPEVASIANETKVMRLLRVRHQTFRNFRLGAIFALGMLLYIVYDNGLSFPTAIIVFGAFFGWCVYTAWNDYRCPDCEATLSRYILLDSKATSCPVCSTVLRRP